MSWDEEPEWHKSLMWLVIGAFSGLLLGIFLAGVTDRFCDGV